MVTPSLAYDSRANARRRARPRLAPLVTAFLALFAAWTAATATEIVITGGVPRASPVVPTLVSFYDDAPGLPSGVEQRIERNGNTIDFYCLVYWVAGTSPVSNYPVCGNFATFDAPGLYRLNFRLATWGAGVYGDYVLRRSVQVWVPESSQDGIAVEYYHAGLDHYFLTADEAEAAALDAGTITGWTRTGATFRVLAPPQAVPGVRPVCRYYGLPSAGLDTHFFSTDPVECAGIAQRWPEKWLLESASAFSVVGPRESGSCPGVEPVVRYFNGRYDVNHRYVVGDAAQKSMAAKGWIREGDAWCSDRPPEWHFSPG